MHVEYVIIGGGTTGCVVAGRLAAGGATVAVLEAGHQIKRDERVDIPANFNQILGDKHLDWRFNTVPQAGLDGREIPLPRGKMLGGTSMLNTMTWARASKDEYDGIAKLNNTTDWSWDDLLPYFKSCETIVPPTSDTWAQENHATFDPAFHGQSGPLRRGFVPWLGESHVPFFKAMNNLGVPTNHDSNLTAKLLFTGKWPLACFAPVPDSRLYFAQAHFKLRPDNILLIQGAHVRRILFHPPSTTDGSSGRTAGGVQFEQMGKALTISATREVILCAGAYETPKILELSGIGDRIHLTYIGVETVIDLPGVGENLQDHLLVPTSAELKPGIVSGDCLQDPEFAKKEMQIYKETGGGQYSSIHSAFSLLQPQLVMPDEKANQILALSHADGSSSLKHVDPKIQQGMKVLYDLQSKWYADTQHGQFEFMHVPQFCTMAASSAKEKTPYLSILAVYMRPFSRGRVHASSSDPSSPPTIDPCYFSNKADLQLMIQAVRFARKVVQTEPLASLVVTPTDPSTEVLGDDAELEKYIKTTLETAHHPMGTAAMMPREIGGVVGPDLRVHGCTNLRVADASIIPIQLSAHPQATLYAVGEKA
ncbi:hypothetical protein FRB96_002409 [Tulasnella sp. 330]|nr:hypothetical protein FRB96_002409 [Tulasnella sp. 330]KAG8885577.1 hypothetical protein FRB97_000485 [Tulasnella sp. 331]KAG8889911.1 hypothetical protein FRB98_001957 [Tulasnella sp. 332]